MEEWNTTKRLLVILDDLMSEADDRVTKLFTKGSHHRNISVMFIVQNLFGRNKEQLTNSNYLAVFKNPRDASRMTHLAKQMYPGKLKYVQESYKERLLQRIKSHPDVTWNPRGEIEYQGQLIKNSNLTDLVNDVLRKK